MSLNVETVKEKFKELNRLKAEVKQFDAELAEIVVPIIREQTGMFLDKTKIKDFNVVENKVSFSYYNIPYTVTL